MKVSHYNPQTHIGEQPVRVLKWNVAAQFENTYPGFAQELFALLSKHGLKPQIKYDYSADSIVRPGNPDGDLLPFVDKDKYITIQETFLSFLWTMCYSHIVLFDEEVNKPALNRLHGGHHTVDVEAARLARELFSYGMTLIHAYRPWDKCALPNPEAYSAEEAPYVSKASAVYMFAVNVILCHELAHIDLGHCDSSGRYVSTFDSILDEIAADSDAVRRMLRGASDEKKKFNYGAGMLLAFTSLLLLKNTSQNRRHPDSDDRIERVLRGLDLDDISPLWGIASLSFRLWDNFYGVRLKWPTEIKTFKDLFYLVLAEVRATKRSTP